MTDDVVITKNNVDYRLSDYGVRVINFDLSSANIVNENNQVGTYGMQTISSKVADLNITLTFDLIADDKLDFELRRLKLIGLFATPGKFFIYSTRLPYVRYKVALQGSVNIPRFDNSDVISNDVTVNMVCSDGYGESLASTLDNINNPNGKWGLGMNIEANNKPKYRFSNNNYFQFFNAGHIPLLADDHPVKIHFNGDVGNSLSITNETTHQTLVINHAMKKSDRLDIIGLIPYLNGQQIYSSCNHAYLDFMIGNNIITINGASNFDISFETKFYY